MLLMAKVNNTMFALSVLRIAALDRLVPAAVEVPDPVRPLVHLRVVLEALLEVHVTGDASAAGAKVQKLDVMILKKRKGKETRRETANVRENVKEKEKEKGNEKENGTGKEIETVIETGTGKGIGKGKENESEKGKRRNPM